jgi:hypothetical protein
MSLELPRAGLGVGLFFVAFSIITATLILTSAKGAQSPGLFVFLFGGIFSIVPAVMGVGIIVNRRRKKRSF